MGEVWGEARWERGGKATFCQWRRVPLWTARGGPRGAAAGVEDPPIARAVRPLRRRIDCYILWMTRQAVERHNPAVATAAPEGMVRYGNAQARRQTVALRATPVPRMYAHIRARCGTPLRSVHPPPPRPLSLTTHHLLHLSLKRHHLSPPQLIAANKRATPAGAQGRHGQAPLRGGRLAAPPRLRPHPPLATG